MMPNKDQLRFSQALQAFLMLLPEQSRILEIDPGRGLYSREFFDCGHSVIGIHPPSQPLIENKYLKEVFHKEVDNVLVPYRHLNAIWAHRSLSTLSEDKCGTRLSLFYDWLAKGGILYFCQLEGDGHKWVTEQSPAGQSKKLLVYYRPEVLEAMMNELEFEVIDAWREQQVDKSLIHILARRPA